MPVRHALPTPARSVGFGRATAGQYSHVMHHSFGASSPRLSADIYVARTRRRRPRPVARAGWHGPDGAAHHTPLVLGLAYLTSRYALHPNLPTSPSSHTLSQPPPRGAMTIAWLTPLV